MQDMTWAVQVCLSLTVPFTDEELFVSCQCCFPWGVFSLLFLPSLQLVSLFSFLHLQGCLQQSPGRQSYLEAQGVLLLSLGHVPAPTLGWSKARVGSTAPCSALSWAQPALSPGRGRAEPSPGEGQLQELGHSGRFSLKWNAIN